MYLSKIFHYDLLLNNKQASSVCSLPKLKYSVEIRVNNIIYIWTLILINCG
jgi:hypothetical protein